MSERFRKGQEVLYERRWKREDFADCSGKIGMTAEEFGALAKAPSAVITVGDGRGFVVGNYVITAAHCLPWLPPCLSFSYTHERTYRDLLALLGGKPHVWTECLFVDPIGDIAVLGEPEPYNQYEDYWRLMEDIEPLGIEPPGEKGWLLSLDGDWFECGIGKVGATDPLWLTCPSGKIAGGMSGSPVISANGAAVGIVCCEAFGSIESQRHGPTPSLIRNLPGWLLSEIRDEERKRTRRRPKK
jgi:hypothetical protein